MRTSEQGRVACDIALAALGWLYLVFAYVVVEYSLPYVSVCPFFLLSGLHCPLCGSTRFVGMWLHGTTGAGTPSMTSVIWVLFISALTVSCTARVVVHFCGRDAKPKAAGNAAASSAQSTNGAVRPGMRPQGWRPYSLGPPERASTRLGAATGALPPGGPSLASQARAVETTDCGSNFRVQRPYDASPGPR